MSFLYIVEDFAPSVEEIRDRENIRWELEQFIQELYPSRCLSHLATIQISECWPLDCLLTLKIESDMLISRKKKKPVYRFANEQI